MELKKFRKAKGMTQDEVASSIGVPRRTYQNYELEVREPDSDILCKLADLYGVTLDELLGRTIREEGGLSHAETELVRYFESMNDDSRDILMVLARELSRTFPAQQ